MTAVVLFALLGAATLFAIAAAWVAIRRHDVARAALRARDQERDRSAELANTLDADSRLAGDVAHDLNDLVTAINGQTELLIASLDPSWTGIENAYEIRRAARSAARLTKSLRALSSADRTPTDVMDVNAAATRAAEGLRQILGPKIAVTLALGGNIKRVRIAAHHLEEIVLHIGSHAGAAMPHGGSLTLTTRMHVGRDTGSSEPSEYVRLVVAGAGNRSSDSRTTLLEPFAGCDNDGGNAVPLSKVDQIVKQAGGRHQTCSTAGVGTTFTVDLPAVSQPPPAVHDEGDRVGRPLKTPVLVVEDEPGMRELIKAILLKAGHEVVAVAGPHAALAVLNRQPDISLMLVDVVMPKMDGYDLVAEARKISPGVRVVFTSAFAPDPTRHSNGDGFLAKPFTNEALIDIVDKTLSY